MALQQFLIASLLEVFDTTNEQKQQRYIANFEAQLLKLILFLRITKTNTWQLRYSQYSFLSG
jgi:hypothetical protein